MQIQGPMLYDIISNADSIPKMIFGPKQQKETNEISLTTLCQIENYN